MNDRDSHSSELSPKGAEEGAPLSSFIVSSPEGRSGFLWRLSEIGEEGLLAATSHVWNALALPKAARCTKMALSLGSGGTGKKALYGVLKLFLAEFEVAFDPPPLPEREYFQSDEEWHAAIAVHFASGDAAAEAVIKKFSAVLNGEEPPVPQNPAEVIQGPWKAKRNPSRKRSGPKLEPDLSHGSADIQRFITAWRYVYDDWLSHGCSGHTLDPTTARAFPSLQAFIDVANEDGWTARNLKLDFPLTDALTDPEGMLRNCPLEDVRRFIHALVQVQAQARAGADDCPILDAFRSGAMSICTIRLAQGIPLYPW